MARACLATDQSIDSRVVVWKHFPQMLAAAPGGWGWGKAGDAYTQWFQPADQSINYLNLLNSHFTWMAEGGWAYSAFYIAGWCAVILLCWPVRDGWGEGSAGWPFGLPWALAAFLVRWKTHLWLWLVPILLLGVAVHVRLRRKAWPALGSWALGALVAASAVIAIIWVGLAKATLPIKADGGTIVIGEGKDTTIIYVDREVMGKLYGHTLRKFFAGSRPNLTENTYIVTERLDYVAAKDAYQIILSGKMACDADLVSRLHSPDQVILVNPACFPEEITWSSNVTSRARVYFGEYSQFPSRSSWESCPGVRFLVIEGAGDFVPGWPGAIWKPAGSEVQPCGKS